VRQEDCEGEERPVALILVVVLVGGFALAAKSRGDGNRTGMTMLAVVGLLALLAFGMVGARGRSGPEVDPPRVSFVEPLDGTEVASPVRVVVDAVRLAGNHIDLAADVGCGEGGGTVHLHEDAREATLELSPGEHRICVQAYDSGHTGHHPVGEGESVTVLVAG
jgi:hypothetical protein